MAHDDMPPSDRRTFLQAGAFVAASAASLTPCAGAQEARPAAPASLPKRRLGKTGTEITVLDIGTGRGRGVGRLLRYAYAQGIRAFDTSAAYQSEPDFKDWFNEVNRRPTVEVLSNARQFPGRHRASASRLDLRQ